jgi:hypothetical protein
MSKRLTPLLFALALLIPHSATADVLHKTDIDTIRVSLEVKDIPLRDAIQQLISQTRLQIVYNDAFVNGIKASCSCKNFTLREALEQLLKNTPLTFRAMKDGQVVIVKRSYRKKRNLKGYIKDAETGETLPYANIIMKGTQQGTASNVSGYFVLVNVADGPCTLRVEYIGYEPVDLPISESQVEETIVVKMRQRALQGAEVTVTAENMQTMEVADDPGQIRISPRQISTLPSVGEVDIFRSLQLLPGISGVNDGSSGLYVRGGTPDQNLVLFDGITIYQVDHFFGFISAFNTEAIKDVRVFKGGFPAKFGGRTSSVVELTGKSGSYDKFQAGGSLNLLSGSGIVQVPISGRGAWLVSFRRSYTDIIKSDLYNSIYNSITGQNRGGGSDNPKNNNPVAGPGQRGGPRFAPQQEVLTPDFYYYDLNSKLSYALSGNDILSLSLYNGRDNLDMSQDLGNLRFRGQNAAGGDTTANALVDDITEWGNIGMSGKWSRVWSDRIYSNLLIAHSTYSSESRNGLSTESPSQNSLARAFSSSEQNEVKDLTIGLDNEWQISKSHKLELGVWYSKTDVNLLFTANDSANILNRDDEAIQTSFYVQDKWNVLSPLQLTLGVRTTNYEPTQTTYVEPRASFKLSLGESLSFKGAWGEYNQFVNRITNENVLQGNRDFWLLANDRLEPSFAEHKILGLSYENREFLFDVEAYHKDLDGVAEFSRRFRRSPDTPAEALFFLGTGISKGIEFLAQKKSGKFNGWASYTLGKVEYQFPAFNGGEPFPADQDRRHEVKLVGNYSFGRWNFAATWVYATGAPYTAPESQYGIELLDGTMRSFIHVGDKNANRMPAYHRMDMSFTRRFSGDWLDVDLGISVFNLYDHTNVWYREYLLDASPVIIRDVATLGLTPTVSLKVNLK